MQSYPHLSHRKQCPSTMMVTYPRQRLIVVVIHLMSRRFSHQICQQQTVHSLTAAKNNRWQILELIFRVDTYHRLRFSLLTKAKELWASRLLTQLIQSISRSVSNLLYLLTVTWPKLTLCQ